MDLSGLKWPLIIAVILGIGFLGTGPGINWMVDNFTQATPGADPQRDKVDEAGLTRVAGYLIMLWNYDRAEEVIRTAMERYPEGDDYWYNYYRLAKVVERQKRYQESYNILQELIGVNAHEIDDRVANNDNLALRASKLKETHELQ